MSNIYKSIKVITPFKAEFTDIFTNEKKVKSYISGEMLEGRLDIVGDKTYLVLTDGTGAPVNSEFLSIVKE